jgi:predicted porin
MIARTEAWAGSAATLTRAALLLALAVPVLATPVSAATAKRQASNKVTLQSDVGSDRLHPTTLGTFSPSSLDTKFSFTAPGKSQATARAQTIENAFSFTPSGHVGNRKALTLGVNTRMIATATDTSRAAAPAETLVTSPTGYGVDVAVGWKGFAVSGGYSRVDTTAPTSLNPAKREAVDLGLSYRFKSWKTSLQIAAESGALLPYSPLANTNEQRYSAELGAAYALSPRLSLSGGVRYELTPLAPGTLDPSRIDSSVYLGTAFSF